MKEFKSPLSIRGDCYYCPLAFQMDTYWNCETNCHHCFLRRMNRTWGQDLRPLDIPLFKNMIEKASFNKSNTPLGAALRGKKTIRFGNKSDPYQHAEKEYRRSREAGKILIENNWSFVIQTKYTENVMDDFDMYSARPDLFTLMPIISPGLDSDWRIFERSIPTPPEKRMEHAAKFIEKGINVGVNGEPFIAGYHTPWDFEITIKMLKQYGIKSYNTYFLHMNDLVLKNLHAIGMDIDYIHTMNQDKNWKPILRDLIAIAQREGMILGCPDFVSAGKYQESANTCCGISVPNPCTFNIIQWKKLKMKGLSDSDILKDTWDGVGDYTRGEQILSGKDPEFFSLKDIKELYPNDTAESYNTTSLF